jgi:hypothetical protein
MTRTLPNRASGTRADIWPIEIPHPSSDGTATLSAGLFKADKWR